MSVQTQVSVAFANGRWQAYNVAYSWLDRELGPPGVIGVSAIAFVALSAFPVRSLPWLPVIPVVYLGGYAVLRLLMPTPEMYVASRMAQIPPLSSRM